MPIKPIGSVEISLDPPSAGTAPLKALVYDVTEKRLILSQTSPPITSSQIEKHIHISYMERKGNSVKRFGCLAVISGFSDNYRLSSGIRVPTLIVDIVHKPTEISLRKGFRVRPPRQGGISMAIGKREYPILDISLTGIKFIQRFSDPPLKTEGKFECILTINGQSYPPLEARVIRVSKTAAALHIAAVFVGMDKTLQLDLSKKILMLEREELSRYI